MRLRIFDRSYRLSLPLILWVVVGCHGGPETDVIERELRWQEDQIYALEDYLMEYQAKVRRLREENRSLASALADCGGNSKRAVRPPSTESSRDPARSRATDGPTGLTPRTMRSATDARVPPVEAEPEVPPVFTPDVPPLEFDSDSSEQDSTPDLSAAKPHAIEVARSAALPTTWISERAIPPARTVASDSQFAPGAGPSPAADAAFDTDQSLSTAGGNDLVSSGQRRGPHELEATGGAMASSLELPWLGDEPASVRVDYHVAGMKWLGDAGVPTLSFRASSMLMELELLPTPGANERYLQASLSPLTDNQEPALFTGQVSLMLRDPALSGADAVLERWDFDEGDVQRAWFASPHGRRLSFSLPLPARLSETAPVELWVRLLPAGDEPPRKILDHMSLQLADMIQPSPVQMGSDWVVAKPGQPVLLEMRSHSTTQWRTADAQPPASNWAR